MGKDNIDDKNMFSWSMFGKTCMPYCNFTFWEWYYCSLLLTKNNLRELWNEGLLMGFLSKTKVETLMFSKPIGIHLLHFSETKLGAVCIGYKTNLFCCKFQQYTNKIVITIRFEFVKFFRFPIWKYLY